MTRTLRMAAVAALTAAVAAPTARADQIDRVMVQQADEIAKAVRGLGGKNVAVLKFETQIGSGAATHQAGVMNSLMAKRLEHLLVLTNDVKQPLMVLVDAGQAATALAKQTRTPITWKTPAGRQELFKVQSLPLAWDDKTTLDPDAYVTGKVIVSPDMRSTEVILYGFTRDTAGKPPRELYTVRDKINGGSRSIKTDRSMLSRLGQSFAVKGRSRSATASEYKGADDEAIADVGVRNDNNAPVRPGVDTPVKVEVYADDQLISPEGKPGSPGETRLRLSPQAGQKLYFKLTNTDPAETYGVLLAVNGENTAFFDGDTLDGKAEHEQRMWVLGPGTSGTVAGYYTEDTRGTFKPFEVLPEEESAQRYSALNPKFAGLISVRVFGRTAALQKPGVAATEGQVQEFEGSIQAAAEGDATTLANEQPRSRDLAGRSPRTSRSLEAAQKYLLDATRTRLTTSGKLTFDRAAVGAYSRALHSGRGIIVGGQEFREGGPVQLQGFERDPSPVASWDWEYYKP